MKANISFLARKAYNMRVSSAKETAAAGSGHVTSALSAADIVAVLFFYIMRFDPDNFTHPDNDRFILSKGHAAPILYAVWKELGKLSEKDLLTYRKIDSVLEGHPTLRFSYSEAATGSLGIGLSIGLGMALNARMDGKKYYTYVLMGDSETSEGSVWEAVEIAAYYNVDNLVGIIDMNRLGQSTETMYGRDSYAYVQRFAAFGWETFEVDGHDIKALVEVFEKARSVKGKPTIIIAKTYKGYGIDYLQDKEGFHGKPIENIDNALEQLKKNFPQAATYQEDERFYPNVPESTYIHATCVPARINITSSKYVYGNEIPTRQAYGKALVDLADICDTVISLDAEVKNSTFAEYIEKAHPDRFIQCFIAEQNMVSMAVGFNLRGKIPFVSTFGAFLSRAHDQLRMAAIGQASLRVVGSHAGVSIGEDGPSQMALEDIAMMRGLPESVVLYPSDAVSTHKLVECMARNEKGITYLRTTRAATPVIYDPAEDFEIGGCKVIYESADDSAVIIAAGITLHEARKAYEKLKQKQINIAVIDLYCIKPLDIKTIVRVAQKSGNHIITAEDHYIQGGIGESICAAVCNYGITVKTLAVKTLPRSGSMAENLAHAQIDCAAIIQAVHSIK